MTDTIERKFPTADEVFQKLTDARELLDSLEVHESYTIADYPIGGSNRGQCRLSVESNKRGSRTVRETTNKYGRWCKPKKSTYSPSIRLVVTGERLEKEAGWLSISMNSIAIKAANGEWTVLAEAPCIGRPRREPKPYTIETERYSFGANGLEKTNERQVEHRVLEADPPELCDAYDAWHSGIREIITWFQVKHKQNDDAS